MQSPVSLASSNDLEELIPRNDSNLQSSLKSASFNYINSIIGSGVIGEGFASTKEFLYLSAIHISFEIFRNTICISRSRIRTGPTPSGIRGSHHRLLTCSDGPRRSLGRSFYLSGVDGSFLWPNGIRAAESITIRLSIHRYFPAYLLEY